MIREPILGMYGPSAGYAVLGFVVSLRPRHLPRARRGCAPAEKPRYSRNRACLARDLKSFGTPEPNFLRLAARARSCQSETASRCCSMDSDGTDR